MRNVSERDTTTNIMEITITPAEFAEQLLMALNHLHDPAYQPTETLLTVVGQSAGESFRAEILQAIESLTPSAVSPANSPSRRVHDLLVLRYVQGLTQEVTAERLGITSRHLRRQQQQAVRVLAQHMLNRLHARLHAPASPASAPTSTRPMELPDHTAPSTLEARRSQIRSEIEILLDKSAGSATVLADIMQKVAVVGSSLTRERDVTLRIAPTPPTVIVSIHPSVLHQIVLMAIEAVSQHMASGEIAVTVEDTEPVILRVAGTPGSAGAAWVEDSLLSEVVGITGGQLATQADATRIAVEIRLPSANKINVLVVDDNADLVHFYRRYTVGTRYHIHHVSGGQDVFEASARLKPDVIVLDIMLPDIDGWELLMWLREQPLTRSTPIVVCSVVGGNDLAASLGAKAYIPKPVGRFEFIQALDRALAPATT